MNDAPNLDSSKLENKLSSIKSKLPNAHENKLKSLEARFMGPSANGSLPYEYELINDMDYDYIKSKFSNKSETNTANNDSQIEKIGKINNDPGYEDNLNLNLTENNQVNSNNLINTLNNSNNNNFRGNSARKKNESKKAEKTTKLVGGVTIDYLSTKRTRTENINQNNNSNSGLIDSKNLILKNTNQNFLNLEVKEEENNNNNINNNVNNLNNANNNNNNQTQNQYFSKENSNNNKISTPIIPRENNLKKQNSFNYGQNTINNNMNNGSHDSFNQTKVNNKTFQNPNNISNNILTNNHIENNVNNLNKFLNIQNDDLHHINFIQEFSFGSEPCEESIEFSSKNIMSSNYLFFKNNSNDNKDQIINIQRRNNNNNNSNNNSNNIPNNNINQRPYLKNQMNLDNFTIKNLQNQNNNNINNNVGNSQKINDTKINSYFNKTPINSTINSSNTGGNITSNSEDKSLNLLKQNYLKLVEDKEKLIRDLGEKNKTLNEREKENEKLKLILLENEENFKSITMLNKTYESQLLLSRKSLIKYLKDNEESKRNLKKIWLNEQAYRLGKFSIQRAGARLMEVWEDGEEINNIKNAIKEIKNNKEDLEKVKKRLSLAIKKKEMKEKELSNSNTNNSGNNCSSTSSHSNTNNYSTNLNSNTKESSSSLSAAGLRSSDLNINGNNSFMHPMNIYHSNNIFSFGASGNLDDYTEHEINELRELINFKLTKLTKDESECLEKLEKLEIEKIKYQIEFKRYLEEEKCRYGPNSKEKWPVLANRYLILSLLGRGGYSEVYRGYDLENNMEVACKIHQLNPSWTDSIKENYIRHTIRENQIHKEINHPKVVKHYDTIEIDTSSFCTVLELCSGPDLYTYLKLNKTFPEKDARIVVSQILSGVKYLNELQKKIIHYDLKPQNIIFNNMEVKISDFGLAKIMEDNSDKIELTSQGVGTYWYLPPECFDTDKNPPGISSKVDVWSIGVILYELVFGIRPFGHSLTQDRILKENVISNAKKVEFPQKPGISEECKDFIKKCLAHNQDERFDVFEALESGFIKGLNQKKSKN